MKKIFAVCLFFLGAGVAWAGDEFSSVRCGGDIPRALLGKTVKGEKVRVTEGRHKDIGLEHLGIDELPTDSYLSTWRICGKEYFLLVDGRDVIRDVLLFPGHDTNSPAFGGYCLIDDKEVPDYIYGVLEKKAGMETYSVKAAWKVDEKYRKFVSMPVDGMHCPSDNIFSVDR